jgi:DNA-binding NarL/FixJ family response regulator
MPPLTRPRIMVVEDQPLYRQMLTMLLSGIPDLELVGAYESAADARTVDAAAVDVALLDLHLPDGDGMSVGRALRAANPRIGIVLLSASDQMHTLLELPRAEADGWSYLSKTSSLGAAALLHAIRQSSQGRSVLDPAIRAERDIRADGPLAALSRRQREVLALVADGLTNTAIAERLALSSRSVDAHLAAVYAALGIHADGDRNPRVDAVRAFLAHTAPRG